MHVPASWPPSFIARYLSPRAACLAGALMSLPLAPPLQAQPATASVAWREYRVAAGPLADALDQFARQAGVSVAFEADALRASTSRGLSGRYTVEAGLAALLAGSGFRAESATGGFRLAPVPGPAAVQPLPTVHVRGQGIQDMAGTASSRTLAREQLDRIPPTSTGDIFREMPGVVAINNRNGPSLDVNIRGVQGMGRVKILVDGTQSTSSDYKGYAGDHSHSYVDPELLGSVTVEKGPNAGPYGAGATGGVVSLRTLEAADLLRDGRDYGVRLRASHANKSSGNAGTGQDWAGNGIPGNNLLLSAAGAWRANEHLDLVAGVSHRRSGNYTSGRRGTATFDDYNPLTGEPIGETDISFYKPGDEIHNTSQDTQSGLVKARLRLPHEQTLDLGIVDYRSTFGQIRQMAFDWATMQMELSKTRKQTYTARYAWSPSGNPLIDLRANVWMAKADEYRASNALSTVSRAQDANTRSRGAEIWNTSRFAWRRAELDLMYGATWFNEKAHIVEHGGTLYQDPSGERNMYSVFSQFEWRPAEWLQLNGGWRYDRYQVEGTGSYVSGVPQQNPVPFAIDHAKGRSNPSIGVTLRPVPFAKLYARHSEGWRPSSIKETLMGYQYARKLLVPELARSNEAGVEVALDGLLAAGHKGTVKAAVFDTRHDNYVVGFAGQFRNIDGARFRGWELGVDYDAGWLFLNYGLTRYTRVEMCGLGPDFNDPCSNVERDPQVDGGSFGGDTMGIYAPPRMLHNLTIGTRWLERRLVVGLRATKAGPRAMQRWNPRNNVPLARVGWAPYTVYDLFASYAVNRHVRLDASVENLRDRFYLDAGTNSVLAIPSPGRTVKATLTYLF